MTAQVVAERDDLEPGETLRLELDAADGSLVEDAIGDVCTHGQVSLSEGEVDGTSIECWLHGSTFDLKTGQPESLPAIRPVPTYPVSYDGDQVLIDIDRNVP